MAKAISIELSNKQRETLRSWLRSGTTENRLARRADIVLRAARGEKNATIARELHTRTATVSKWRHRFATEGIPGLHDRPRTGRPPVYDNETERRILALIDEQPPEGHSRWTGPLIAEHLGDVSRHKVWRVLRKRNISLSQ